MDVLSAGESVQCTWTNPQHHGPNHLVAQLFYLMVNMLLAIVMDAYAEVKESSHDSAPPITEDLTVSAK